MALAVDLTQLLFEAIEEQFGEDADLLQLVPDGLRLDFAPDDASTKFPQVTVEQGEEGGATETAATSAGLIAVDEAFPIIFQVRARTRNECSQIGWQIASAFDGWTKRYTRVRIKSCERQSPPWAGQTAEGECAGSVTFLVSAGIIEE